MKKKRLFIALAVCVVCMAVLPWQLVLDTLLLRKVHYSVPEEAASVEAH